MPTRPNSPRAGAELRLLRPRVLLERKELLGPESFVMNLGRGLNQVLQVSPEGRHPYHAYKYFKLSYLVKKLRSDTNSQCVSSSTFTTPQRFFRPRTALPPMITLLSDPTTANGIMFCTPVKAHKTLTARTTETYPNVLVELHLLFIILISVEWIETDAMME